MSLEAFLAETEKPESGGSGGAFITIAKARVFVCWQGWTNNMSEVFEFEPDNEEDKIRAKTECQTYIDSGSNQFDQWPRNGICTHIFGDDVHTNAEGNFHWGDIVDFVKKYESDLTVFPGGATKPSLFTEDELKLVSGPMPYNLVVEGIKANPNIADWKIHWVKLSQEINQWSKAKGKKNKKGYDLRIHIIQKVYANEAEAKADAEVIKAGQAQTMARPTVANGQLSTKALATWGGDNETALAAMLKQKPAIENLIENAKNGIGPDKKLNLSEAQEWAANALGFEADDLPFVGIELVPF